MSAGLALIIIGTLAYSLGGDWSLVDGLYVAVATLTTSSILDPDLTLSSTASSSSRRSADHARGG